MATPISPVHVALLAHADKQAVHISRILSSLVGGGRYHVAVVYSSVTKLVSIYLDGVEYSYGTQNTINDTPTLMGAMSTFYIGK